MWQVRLELLPGSHRWILPACGHFVGANVMAWQQQHQTLFWCRAVRVMDIQDVLEASVDIMLPLCWRLLIKFRCVAQCVLLHLMMQLLLLHQWRRIKATTQRDTRISGKEQHGSSLGGRERESARPGEKVLITSSSPTVDELPVFTNCVWEWGCGLVQGWVEPSLWKMGGCMDGWMDAWVDKWLDGWVPQVKGRGFKGLTAVRYDCFTAPEF